MVALGTYRTRYTKAHVYITNFVPWGVYTERQHTYEQLFHTVVQTVLLFEVQLTVRFGSLDHAAYIANAFRAVWPDITVLNCYPHVSANAEKKKVF